MFYVVSYDMPDDRKRTKMAKNLLDFGTRVQYSVFECILDDKRLEALTGLIRRTRGKKTASGFMPCAANVKRRSGYSGRARSRKMRTHTFVEARQGF